MPGALQPHKLRVQHSHGLAPEGTVRQPLSAARALSGKLTNQLNRSFIGLQSTMVPAQNGHMVKKIPTSDKE